MVTYAILGNPGHNRVYFEESDKLAISELRIAFARMSAQCSEARSERIAGVGYTLFVSDRRLGEDDIRLVSALSFVYALFELTGEGNLLRPIEKVQDHFLDSDVSSILKYSGKTNELFTRMMLSVAELSSDYYGNPDIRILDPIAGKGTTLFEGLIRGYHVHGIEIGDKVVAESYHYIKKYLETKRYKHISNTIRFSGDNKEFTAKRYQLQIGRSKKDFKENRQRDCEMIAGNALYADRYFKKNFFHLIVGDLPYGVQHGNVTREKQSSLTRSPEALLRACLAGWRDILKPGGTLALAWNTYVFSREDMAALLEEFGFEILGREEEQFVHQVDRSIRRDLVLARK